MTQLSLLDYVAPTPPRPKRWSDGLHAVPGKVDTYYARPYAGRIWRAVHVVDALPWLQTGGAEWLAVLRREMRALAERIEAKMRGAHGDDGRGFLVAHRRFGWTFADEAFPELGEVDYGWERYEAVFARVQGAEDIDELRRLFPFRASPPAGPVHTCEREPTWYMHGYRKRAAGAFLRKLYGGGVLQGSWLCTDYKHALSYDDAEAVLATLWQCGLIERGNYSPWFADVFYGREPPDSERKRARRRRLMSVEEANAAGIMKAGFGPASTPALEAIGLAGKGSQTGLPAYVWHEVSEMRARAMAYVDEAMVEGFAWMNGGNQSVAAPGVCRWLRSVAESRVGLPLGSLSEQELGGAMGATRVGIDDACTFARDLVKLGLLATDDLTKLWIPQTTQAPSAAAAAMLRPTEALRSLLWVTR